MKILFDYQIFYLQKFGGISNYFFNLIKNLENNNKYIIELYAPMYINNYIELLPENIVKGIKLNLNKINLNFYINKYLFNFKQKLFDADIIHLTYYQTINRKNKNSKYILTIYDMIHEQFSTFFDDHNTTNEKKKACEYADHIICISKNTKRNLIDKFNISEKKISVVYLGADHLDNIPNIKNIIKKNFILYVGNRKGPKNFDNFIKSYSINKNINRNYDVVVFGGERVNRNTLIEIKNLGIDLKNIHFLNGNEKILKNLYKNASLFVYPSLDEGFGLPPLEAMSQNCPVAASDIEIFKEVLDNSCLYFNPYSIDDISLKIEKILNEKDLSKKLVNLGTRRKNFYSWSKCAAETAEVYEKVLIK